MRKACLFGVCAVLMANVALAAPKISGEYIEARSCDVYTGPCFANGDIGLTGREAIMAWMIDKGTFNDQDLTGLGAALVLKANDTLGMGGSFYEFRPFPIRSVILVDKKATEAQKQALIEFVKSNASELTKDVSRVESVELSLKNDHLAGKGVFKAGEFASIETRPLKKGDCVCTNETVFYPPLTKVENAHPVYTLAMVYQGKGLNSNWSMINKRSAFMATFSK